MKSTFAISCLVTSVLAAETGAQSKHVGTPQPNVFQEASTLALLTPTNKDLLFEARPALHLYVLNQFGDQYWQKHGQRERGFMKEIASATAISFLPEIRMSTDRSSPVRTPSYRIRATQQAVWMKRAPANGAGFRMTGLKLTLFGHYSNGQSGCRLRGFAPVATAGADSVCAPVDPIVAPQRLPNFDTGDFSTSYFALAFDQRYGNAGPSGDPLSGLWEWGLEYQVHPIGLQPGGTDQEQALTYGMHELTSRYAWERRFAESRKLAGVFRVSALGTTRFGKDAKPIHRSELEVSYVFDGLGAFGFFLRHHAGFDYYNIRYTEKSPFVSFGLRFDPGRLDRVATDP
ncbi:MAG: hypothetical protein ACKVS7_02315 [Gemmatimonadaceae bacterium]